MPSTYHFSGPLSLLPCFPSPSSVGVVHEGCVAYFSLLNAAILGGKTLYRPPDWDRRRWEREGFRDGSRWLGGRAVVWVGFFDHIISHPHLRVISMLLRIIDMYCSRVLIGTVHAWAISRIL